MPSLSSARGPGNVARRRSSEIIPGSPSSRLVRPHDARSSTADDVPTEPRNHPATLSRGHDVTTVIVRSLPRRPVDISTWRRSPGDRAPLARRQTLARGYVPDSDRCTEILIQFGTSFEWLVRQPAEKGERRYGEKTAGPRPESGIGRSYAKRRMLRTVSATLRGGFARWFTADSAIGDRVEKYFYASISRSTIILRFRVT